MKIPFNKMHGLGNDFMIVDNRDLLMPCEDKFIQQLADRNRGVGFDQLLLLENPRTNQADFYYRIFNADGYEVNQCGNGARCIAKFIQRHINQSANNIILQTNAGFIQLTLHDDERVTVNLGKAKLPPCEIPFVADFFANTYALQVEQETVNISTVNLGNPHCVIVVNDIDTAPVKSLGKKIESHARFPERVNVGFMQVIDRNHILLRVYERGVGETIACGSGAAAAVVAGRLRDVLNKQVTVQLLGGQLLVEWQDEQHDVLQTGPTSFVFTGTVDTADFAECDRQHYAADR